MIQVDPNARCVGTWTCPHAQCQGLTGQVASGSESRTSLARHIAVVHPHPVGRNRVPLAPAPPPGRRPR